MMAGDWIKLEIATLDKPEVLLLADMLDISPDEVVGKLLRVWVWFDQNSRDGNAGGVTNVTLMLLIDRLVSRNGFAACMKKVGWLTDSGLPNFERHNGKSAKKRALAVNRVKRFRNAFVTLEALPEKRREEINTTPKAGAVDKSCPVDKSEEPAPQGTTPPDPVVVAHVDALRVKAGVGTPAFEAAAILWATLHANGCKGTASHPQVIEMARMGVTVPELKKSILEARKSNGGQLNPAYVLAIIERLRAEGPRDPRGQAWATDDGATEAKARELGLWPAKPGESFHELRGRIRAVLVERAGEAVR